MESVTIFTMKTLRRTSPTRRSRSSPSSTMGHYLLSIVLLSLCTFTAQALNLDERGILAAFYQGSQGDSWIDHTNWNTDEPICSWFGVKCATGLSNTSGVLALELSGNNVARQVSESLYQMPFLEKVDLRHNPVQDAGFAGMQQAAIDGSLSPLEALDFGYCLLSDVKGIEHAPATLTDIKLTKNQIAAGFPTELLQLTNLQKLYLNFNDMQGSLPTAIGNLIYLKELYLFSNKLTGPLPTEIGRLDKVQFFTLGDNLFEGSIPETVNNMLNIQIFSLHANDKGAGRLTGRVPSFSNAGYLEKLYLADNALTGPLPDDFLQHNSNIDEIVSVNLKNNMITGTLPADMDRFENLDLDLVGNMLDGPLPLSFCDKGRWMSGLVEQYGCAAILCPAGTSNSQGLQMSDEDPCAPCESIPSEFLGATQCGPPPPPPEMGILAELYLALQGSQWEEKEGWDSLDSRIKNGDVSGADLTGLDPCGFHGVICSNDAQVEILALSNNGLRGKIPSSVFLLPALEVLDMSYNYVDMDEESGGFEALKDAKKLLRLKLSHTNIASLDGIGQGTTLDEIFLDGSDFESSLPMELFDLTNLKILHLEASFLTGALPVDISRLTSLTRLQLNENQLNGGLPKELGDLTGLQHLDLSDNDFGGQLPPELNKLSVLRTLRINKCRGGITGNLLTFDQLEVVGELELFNNKLSGSIPPGFLSGVNDPTVLIRVRLNGNQLDGAIPVGLAIFKNMELDLEDNMVSDLPEILCDNHDDWMTGEVGLVLGGCDAILCRPGFWSAHGKAVTRLDVSCEPCEGNQYFGETTCETSGTVKSREAEILDNFFTATGGRYWTTESGNWTKASVPICDREGVKCGEASDDRNSGVTELRLNGFGMRGKIPGEIFELPSIRALAFSHNPVDIELVDVGKSDTLQVLLLSETDLRSLYGIENANDALFEFHAAKNQMDGPFPSQLLQLTSLRNIFLNDNILTGSIPADLSGMSSLRELGIWNNLIAGTIPSELGLLADLERIEAQNNFLSGLLPTELGNLSKLGKVRLSGQQSDNKLTGPLYPFAGNAKMSLLDLAYNNFAGTIPDDFLSSATKTNLITVDLGFNSLSGSIPQTLQSFNQLDIRLEGNFIDAIPDKLCEIAGWMGGLVGETELCDAILCPPGKFAAAGKQTETGANCQECDNILEAPFFGSTSCAQVDFERDVLIKFFEETGGRNWAFQDGWLTDQNICNWYGVACNADLSVDGITLKKNRLMPSDERSDVSQGLLRLPNLKALDLQGDKIGVDLRNIGDDSSLESLILSSTGLTSLKGITKAKKLKSLRLIDNLLTGFFPSEILELTQLRDLYLSFNRFGGSLPSEIAGLTNLQDLYLSGNGFNGTIPTEIGLMTELREVSFSACYFSGTVPSELSTMPFLKKLTMKEQRGQELITGRVPDFAQTPDLFFFDASGNDLSGNIPSNFMAGSNQVDFIVYVILEGNEITGSLPESLDRFTKLNINLANNKIVEIPATLCDNGDWMNGAVREFAGCHAILCPANYFSESGRATTEDPCIPCDDFVPSPFLGQTTCKDDTSERAVLGFIYSATGGGEWAMSKSGEDSLWGTDAPICSWRGIRCVGDKQDDDGVESIQLTFNDMTGMLPPQVWSLPSLKELHLTGNEGLTVSFDGLSINAAVLERLYLSDVNVPKLDGISRASNLIDLFVAGCGLTGILPPELYKLGALEQLDLSWNFCIGPLSNDVGKLTSLTLFEANGNDIQGTIPSELGLLTNLENFVFAETLLSGTIPTELASLPRLQGFSLSRWNKSGRKLTGRLPAFDKSPQLETLVIDGNELTGPIPDNFLSSATKANFVDVSNNMLTGPVPAGLEAFTSLDLRLEGNQISELPDVLCDNNDWMQGAVGKLNQTCDAIMCPPGFAAPEGKAINATSDCESCATDGGFAPFYGSTTCSPIADEREILTQFYEACGGSDWYRSDYWNSSADVCDWYGVGCNDGNVIMMNLEANNLVGTPNSGIFDLPKLQILWLGSNPIDFSFQNIGSARNLMDVRLNQIGLDSVEGLDAALSLTSLDLSFNSLRGDFPEEVFALENIRVLNLRNNDLKGPLPTSFAKVRFLRHLRLDENDFRGPVPAYVDSTVLWNLYLGDNFLGGEIPDNFLAGVPPFAKLVVDLSNNALKGTVPASLRRLEDLTIYLRENQISAIPDELCEKSGWMDGDVGKYGCDAIMCAPGTSTYLGRYNVDADKCVSCSTAVPVWYGQTDCPGRNYSSARSDFMGYTTLWLLLGLGLALITV